jgi:hypothetical protein
MPRKHRHGSTATEALPLKHCHWSTAVWRQWAVPFCIYSNIILHRSVNDGRKHIVLHCCYDTSSVTDRDKLRRLTRCKSNGVIELWLARTTNKRLFKITTQIFSRARSRLLSCTSKILEDQNWLHNAIAPHLQIKIRLWRLQEELASVSWVLLA